MVPYKVSVTPIIGKALSSNRTYHQGLLSPKDSRSLSTMCTMHAHHQHLCVPMFAKFYAFLVVCKCDFRQVLVAMVVMICQQTTHRLTHCHHWKHRLTFFPPSPTPYPDSQPFLPLSPFTLPPKPPQAHTHRRAIYTLACQAYAFYTHWDASLFFSPYHAHKLPLYSRNQIVVPNRNFLPSLTIFLLEPFFLEGMTLNQIISVQVINHQ